jgi:hypothetical protein
MSLKIEYACTEIQLFTVLKEPYTTDRNLISTLGCYVHQSALDKGRPTAFSFCGETYPS